MGVYVSKNQYMRACSADLATFLLANHPESVIKQSSSVLLRADRHVSVKIGYHGFKNWKTGDTGNNIDYLMTYLGYDYPSAVLALTGDTSGRDFRKPLTYIHPKQPQNHKSKIIQLPDRADNYRRIFAYLTARNIPSAIVQDLVKRKILYQSKYGNCIFVTPEQDYCEIRSTNTYADKRCKYRNECKNYTIADHQWCKYMDSCTKYKPDPFRICQKAKTDRFWYYMPASNPETVYICEGAIDAISLYCIHKHLKMPANAVYVSIGGVGNQQTIERLKQADNAVIATDNDTAGNACRDRNSDLGTIIPVNKDWNEDLQKNSYYLL